MNELLYQKNQAVAALNRVEGFEPLEFARTIKQEDQEDQLYLDVKYRKLWFRLAYPLGRIASTIVRFNENMALAEARIYLNHEDAPENYIANAFSMKFRSEDPKFGDTLRCGLWCPVCGCGRKQRSGAGGCGNPCTAAVSGSCRRYSLLWRTAGLCRTAGLQWSERLYREHSRWKYAVSRQTGRNQS